MLYRAAWPHSDFFCGIFKVCGRPALELAKSLALLYSTWYHEHNYIQICMGTERNGQVGRTYWQMAMRYKVRVFQLCSINRPDF